jgi:dCMP deaminase
MAVKLMIETRAKWDKRFLELARSTAKWSQDPSTQVGAVIATRDNRILSLGYNGFPRGVEDNKSRYEDRPLKLKLVCHAERNALDNAHFDVGGATLYSTLFTCNECAKSVIQRGIRKVVSPTPVMENNVFNWEEALLMYNEAGIKFQFID